MSADVETIYLYVAYCAECETGSESDENEDATLEWAANHNAENHDEDDRSDDAYERFREDQRKES
ncbi:MAG TPA: hypothetical protein DEV93_03465 [Chloroflexi bacterium]|jgi:hypothetical protein|nr:hypothetical protein [Chloroflexota bacterium]